MPQRPPKISKKKGARRARENESLRSRRPRKATRDATPRLASPLEGIELIEQVVEQVAAVICQRHEPKVGPNRYTYISPSVMTVFGYTAESFLAAPKKIAKAIFGPGAAEHDRLGRAARESLRPWSWSGPARHKSGRAIWVDMTSTPQRVSRGGILWNILVVDSTARYDAETKANRADQRLGDIARQIPGEIYRRVLGADGKLRYEYIFGQQAARFGYTEETLVRDATVFEGMVHPEDREQRASAIRESARTLERYDIAYRVIAPDGRILWCRSIADPVREANGDVAWNGVVIDITTEKRAEEALVKNRALLRAVVEALPHPIWAKSKEGSIAIWNPAAARYFGRPATEAIGRQDKDVFPPELAAALAKSDRQALQTGGTAAADQSATLASAKREFRSTSVAYRDEDGAVLGTIGVAVDLADRRQAEGVLRAAKEAAELANHAKSEFLAHMSHELRTPLNAIIGFSEIMTREMFGPLGAPSYKEYVADIHASGRHLLRIIDDILNLARIETGRYEIDLEAVALGSIVIDALQVVAPHLRERSIMVRNETSDSTLRVRADERALKQVVLHVLSNAVKFSPNGGTIAVAADGSDPDIMELSIADEGPGIEPGRIPHLFTPFHNQGRSSRATTGPGLGLPVSAKLMELMGGSIRVDSAIGRGTRINLRLPRGEARTN